MVSDPVGDFITQLKNASAVRKESVILPYSKLKFSIAQKLESIGYVKAVSKRGKKIRKSIQVDLLYGEKGAPRISGAQRLSKPGRRVYRPASKIYPVRYGKGALILTTPKGILADWEARKEKVGGEALFKMW
jgi:small subunit ribosomal protein S8